MRPATAADGVDADAPRVVGNERLTAATALILLFLLAAEGVTVLRVGRLLRWHVFLGTLLIPPVMVKLASTFYRFVRYYRGDPEFRRKGPPPWLLRVLGPLVATLTIILFASGIALMWVGTTWHGRVMFIHKASFILWFAVMTIHVVGHLPETLRLGTRDWIGRRVAGAAARRVLLVISLVVGGVAGWLILARINPYLSSLTAHFIR